MSAVEVYVSRVEPRDGGLQLQLSVHPRPGGPVHARLGRDGRVLEVHIGDDSWSDYIDRGAGELTARDDLVGSIARKAREFGLLNRLGRRAA